MSSVRGTRGRAAERALLAAAQGGDEAAFASLVEPHRRELQVHCYRMLGSLEDAEDLVQETFLNAWRKRAGFQGRSSYRTWLYRIATNACLNALESRPRRLLPQQVVPPGDPSVPPLPPADLPWLQPYPDVLLEGLVSSDAEPGAVVLSKETIELAFLAAIQHLSPRQRAVLILRDALGWSASETASLLDTSVAAVHSALRRARTTLKTHLPARRLEWAPSADPSKEERSLLQRYMDAWERADATALAALLHEDVRLTMPPTPTWYEGRAAVAAFYALHVFGPGSPGHIRIIATGANMQPALALYVQREGDAEHRAFALEVLRIDGGAVADISGFILPRLFPAFGLPATI